MKKGEKALKYADLLWGDEKVRRITLEDLCRCWNISRLLNDEEFYFGMRVFSQKERYKLSHSKKATLYYAYLVFRDWTTNANPHLNTKALSKVVKYLMALTLVQHAKFCTCKEIFSFLKYDLRKLKDRDRKTPRPIDLYRRQADPQAISYIQKVLNLLQNPKTVQNLSKLLHIPLTPQKGSNPPY